MSAVPSEADVVVVGAGPVGLTVGITLAYYGVDVVVLDAAEQAPREGGSTGSTTGPATCGRLRDPPPDRRGVAHITYLQHCK
ncbi:FAD-dependent oxidoreductase [Spiractinospora alimapuensis]|uniref:FAD-dependent oxidoreductase n=1 Tax=Spiractinospora alimapuensis TaxID=2820884 RepID=UPI001F2F5F0D|nr:FAD-dependent oxidoreductase [Spiractinospora alimapuensis]QVQ50396.1 FAD-dependent oxidoreductase [Spiractinospora alimapuensis]